VCVCVCVCVSLSTDCARCVVNDLLLFTTKDGKKFKFKEMVLLDEVQVWDCWQLGALSALTLLRTVAGHIDSRHGCELQSVPRRHQGEGDDIRGRDGCRQVRAMSECACTD
jgi:hypothetical protein